MNNLAKKLKASLWALGGLFFVFFMIITLNDDGGHVKEKPKKQSASFEMKKVVKPKAKPKPKPKPKKQKAKPKRSAPAPQMSAGLSGIDMGLDGFGDAGMDDMGDSLLGDVNKNVVMSEDAVDVAPKPTQRSAMQYPKKARKNAITGYVIMNLLIASDGTIEKVKILESEPAGVFDDVALAGIQQWQFSPAQYQGKSVKVWAKQKIRFDLQ